MNINEPENRINGAYYDESKINSDKTNTPLHGRMSFRQAIENSIPSGIAVMDGTGKQVYVNHAFCKMVGWEENELLGKFPPYPYWPLQEIDTLNNALERTLNDNAPEEGFYLEYRHKTGKSIPVNVMVSPFEQEDNTLFFLANVIDLTQLKKDQEALKESHLYLMSSIESQKDIIIFSIDQDYDYLYFNKSHRDAMKFAYNSEVSIGINFLDSISREEDRRLLKEKIDLALRGESQSIIQTFGEINLGYYEVFINPILNEKNKIIGCTCFAKNITDRIEAEKALKESETKFKEIINQVNDAIIVFDQQGKIIIWNRGAEQLSGINASEILNRNIVDIRSQLIPDQSKDKELNEKNINDIITFQTPEKYNKIIDGEIINPDSGSVRNIQSMVFPIELNTYQLFCAVVRDTTEIKRYEKELLRISADKDKFFSIIAQYLYTPFNVFKNFSKLMAEELDSLPIREIQKMANIMSKSASNLYSLLDGLIQWTRMNQGKIPFEPQKINFRSISQDAVSLLKQEADAKNIRINYSVSDGINIYADIFMLKMILRNLVTNAIKFADINGQINIYVQETSSDTIISVQYEGITITSDYLTKLFDFSQVHSTVGAPEEKGTTLGLLLCNEYVEKHGGKIWVEGDGGKRCEFKFTLPNPDGKAKYVDAS